MLTFYLCKCVISCLFAYIFYYVQYCAYIHSRSFFASLRMSYTFICTSWWRNYHLSRITYTTNATTLLLSCSYCVFPYFWWRERSSSSTCRNDTHTHTHTDTAIPGRTSIIWGTSSVMYLRDTVEHEENVEEFGRDEFTTSHHNVFAKILSTFPSRKTTWCLNKRGRMTLV